MDIELNTLLVALMFVTILCMGIGNILVTLADILNAASASRRSRVQVSWLSFLLITHFNLFWHTKEILRVENWRFGGFLMTIAGPLILFFATSILLSRPSAEDEADLDAFFVHLARPFFLMFGLLQVWILFAGYTMSGRWIMQDALNVGLVGLALVLAFGKSSKVQNAGAAAGWLLLAGIFLLRYLGGGSA